MPSFINGNKPILTAMIELSEPDAIISEIRNSLYEADAIGIELADIRPEFRNVDVYSNIFQFAEDKPIYVTNYRNKLNTALSDEELEDGLMMALKAGATLIDVMGDMYSPSEFELTYEKKAIERQMELISRIHEQGGEVLMSSHIHQFLPEEKVLEIAYEQEKRGADISKIVTWADTEEELMANLQTSMKLKRQLKIPFLFLANGRACKIQRVVGYMFGSAMVLCVQKFRKNNLREQPLLRAERAVVSNADINCWRR